MRKAVITGASGPLGHALIDELLKHNYTIIAICRKGSPRIEFLPKSDRIQVIEANLNELYELNIDEKCDIFYHFAWALTAGNEARDNVATHIDNIKYTLDAVELARKLGCSRFIGAGSQAEYGRVNLKMNEKVPTNPESAYGMAKLCAGQMSRLRCEQLGIEHIWTRILSVYGPYDSDNTLVMSVIKGMLNNEEIRCTQGEQMWDYIYSEDAALALYLLGEKGRSGKTYCIGSGEGKALKKYIEEIKKQLKSSSIIEWGAIPYSEKQVMYLCADIEDLVKDVGFKPKYKFIEGIKNIIQILNEDL